MAIRKIDGKNFTLAAEYLHKSRANEVAKEKRNSKTNVRVVKSNKGNYLIYTRKK